MITEQQEKNFGLDLIDKASLAATILDKAVSGANFIAGASHAVSVAQALVIPLQIVGPVATVIGFMAWIAQLERSARAAKVRGEIESLHNQFYRDFNRLEGWWERQNCPVNVYKANWYKAAPYAIAQYHKKSLEGTINNPLNIFSKPMDIFSGMSKRWN